MIMQSIFSKKCAVLLIIAVLVIAIIVTLLLNPIGILDISGRKNEEPVSHKSHCYIDPPDVMKRPRPSDAKFGNYKHAVVTSNGYLCAKIGKDILLENGTAVDAAIAILICEGVLCPQSLGFGGGFIMTVYDKSKGEVKVLNAREYAPAAATVDMFAEDEKLSIIGGLAIAVPTQLKGFEEAYKRYGGGVSWNRLFEPSIKICEEGFPIYSYLAYHINKFQNNIYESPTLREILVDPITGKVLQEGDLLKRPKLAKMMRAIAEEGIDVFYKGSMAEAMAREIEKEGGIMTAEDFKNVSVQWMEPIRSKFEGYHVYSPPLPSVGVLIAFMLNVLQDFLPARDEITSYQRIVESFKFAYGSRTALGDIAEDHFVPDISSTRELLKNLTSLKYAENIRKSIRDDRTNKDPKYYGATVAPSHDFGTAHINVLAPNGDAVSATSTINLIFGCKFRSNTTDTIFNNEMSDFSSTNITNPFGLPPSPTNFIKPGKRPLSSMSPVILLDENNKDVVLLTGASGGSRITSTTLLIILNNLIFGKNIKESIDERRFHHQLFPMEVDYEYGFLAQHVKKFEEIGHETCRTEVRTSSASTSIARYKGNVTGCYDFRRGGSVDGF